MLGYVVRQPFTRINPVTGLKQLHAKGDVITESARISDIKGSAHERHVVNTHLPEPKPAAPAGKAKASNAAAS